jgi:CheY-like chemotaxis protein
MSDFEAFENELGNALNHLYDPDYRPTDLICSMVNCTPAEGPGPVQAILLEAITSLKPSPGIPPTSRSRRDYDVLYHRFAFRLTQEETAEALHLSLRTVQRAQREAMHTLAMLLWQGVRQASEPTAPISDEDRTAAWRTQAEQELASLHKSAPDSVTDVTEIIEGLLEIERALVVRKGVTLKMGHVQPNLVAAVHPSVLRQTLIAVVGRLARHMSSGPITVYAGLEDAAARITLTGIVDAGRELNGDDLTRDILVPEGGHITAIIEEQRVFVYIHVPSTGQVTVLAVDDNPDMLHFYRRCTAGTRYHVVQATTGQEALAHIRAHPPDVVVLDVMLPDIDGWQLLIQLHEDPITRTIPVIVCSVVREEDLATSLGAAHYLPKPVQPRRFVQALDQVHPRG